MSALKNPKAPHNQPFNLNGRKNQTKKRSWWSSLSPTYWRDRNKKPAAKAASTEE